MYQYARTRNRVHRVFIDGGKAFKVEQCNLDDTGFLHLDDAIPEGQHCAYCWIGWVEPTPEEKVAEEEAAAKAADQIPENTKPISLVTSTRRMAVVVLAAAILGGTALGAAASPDMGTAVEPSGVPVAAIEDLRRQIDDLFVQIRVLSVDINGHVHEPIGTNAPIIVVIPTATPTIPVATPASTPVPTPVPEETMAARRSTDETVTRSQTTIIVVPAPTSVPVTDPVATLTPTPAPTAQPTPVPIPTPCPRPGGAVGAGDPCRWPHN